MLPSWAVTDRQGGKEEEMDGSIKLSSARKGGQMVLLKNSAVEGAGLTTRVEQGSSALARVTLGLGCADWMVSHLHMA